MEETASMQLAMRAIPPSAFAVAAQMISANKNLLYSLQPETREMVVLAYDMQCLKERDDEESD